jgi:anaerobic selenocysteine-containing dehydrogenase
MICPPHPSCLNSSFVNIPALRAAAGEPIVEIHPVDASARGIEQGEMVRVYNDRGDFHARAIVGENVKPGVIVSLGIWWNKYVADGRNCNSTVSSRLTDFGGGATFFDNLVQVEPV